MSTEIQTQPSAKARRTRRANPVAIDQRLVKLAVDRLQHAKAAAKALWDEADRIQDELAAALGDRFVTLDDGRVVSVRNNFRDKDGNSKSVAFKTTAVRMLEIDVK